MPVNGTGSPPPFARHAVPARITCTNVYLSATQTTAELPRILFSARLSGKYLTLLDELSSRRRTNVRESPPLDSPSPRDTRWRINVRNLSRTKGESIRSFFFLLRFEVSVRDKASNSWLLRLLSVTRKRTCNVAVLGARADNWATFISEQGTIVRA